MYKVDLDRLNKLVADEYVKAIKDPEGSQLTLYNYTFRTTIDNKWDEITRLCRGLVLSHEGNIIAMPFRKFFNLGEQPETQNLPSEVPQLSDKLDGSMIVCFWDEEKSKWRAVTRGAWDSLQASWVNKNWIPDNLQSNPNKHLTFVFELTAPWNRIVCVYSETHMTLIGVNNNNLAKEENYEVVMENALAFGWDHINFGNKPISEIDLAGKFSNMEGYVALYSNGLRVKIKYSEYCSLHKILTCLSIKGIWEMLSAGGSLDLNNLPDEFLSWYNAIVKDFNEKYSDLRSVALRVFEGTDPSLSRKEKALLWSRETGVTCSVCFCLLDNRPFDKIIWKSLKPTFHKTFQLDQEG